MVKSKITVTGVRAAAFESWKVIMKIKSYDFKEDQVAFELYASGLNSETIHFNWTDSTHCTIVFKQHDNTERTFWLTASVHGVQLSGGNFN